MQIHDISISLLREYDNNPRNNDGAVDAVAASIRVSVGGFERFAEWGLF